MGKGLHCVGSAMLPLWEAVSCGICAAVPPPCWPGWLEPQVPSCSHAVAQWNLLWALCSLLRTVGLLPAHLASCVFSRFKPRSHWQGFQASQPSRNAGKPSGPVCLVTSMHSTPGCPGSDLSARRKDRNLIPSFLSHPHTHSCA